MEGDYEDIGLGEEPNNGGYEPKDDDWFTGGEPEDSAIDKDDLWLHEDPLTVTDDKSAETNISSDEWSESNDTQENIEPEDGSGQHKNITGSAISFTGYGRCDCGCGSFGGHGNICTYCGHPYSAHSRYKK